MRLDDNNSPTVCSTLGGDNGRRIVLYADGCVIVGPRYQGERTADDEKSKGVNKMSKQDNEEEERE